MGKIFVFVVSVIVFLSCSTGKNQDCISIDLKKDSEKVSSDIFPSSFFSCTDSVDFDIGNEFKLKEIYGISFDDSLIFIFDKKSNNVLIFDDEGKLKSRIGKTSSGRNKYVFIKSFYLDKRNKTVNIIDPVKMNISEYNYEGNFLSARKIRNDFSPFISDIKVYDSTLVCTNDINWINNKTLYEASKCDLHTLCNMDSIQLFGYDYNSFCRKNTVSAKYRNILFTRLFSNTLWQYKNEKSPYVKFVTKCPALPDYIKKDLMKADFSKYVKGYRNKYSFGLEKVFETSEWIYLSFFCDDYSVLMDKKTFKCFLIIPSSTALTFKNIIGVYNDKFVVQDKNDTSKIFYISIKS